MSQLTIIECSKGKYLFHTAQKKKIRKFKKQLEATGQKYTVSAFNA